MRKSPRQAFDGAKSRTNHRADSPSFCLAVARAIVAASMPWQTQRVGEAGGGVRDAAGEQRQARGCGLGEGGDEFFQQVSAVIHDDDLSKQGSATQQ